MLNKYPVAKPNINKQDIQGVLSVLKSGYLSLGPKYLEFEKSISSFVKSKYACAVSSGTAGLHLAVLALGLKEGDEVITTPLSFIASSNCLLYEKITPVFVDVDQKTYNIDPQKIEAAITKKTKAILVVHYFGQSTEMDKIMKIAKKHNLKVIEDACESLGATYKNKYLGTFGDIGVFAFYPNKQITTGEGGMIVTNSVELYKYCWSMRNQGRGEYSDWLAHDMMGYNYRMDEMSASLGVTQMTRIKQFLAERNRLAMLYSKYLKNIPNIILPTIAPNRTHAWYVYAIRVMSVKRSSVMEYLTNKGIQTKPYFPVIHLQPYIKRQFKFKSGLFPIAEKISQETIALPFYIGLKEKDIKYICDQIRKAMSNG